ncbi:g11774 [Coccomyxa viridis]|uniref:G11774 protein n=1 Tax=Coccomyxa viridis TaxID=1274662 RepID=A0ABP1GCX0_9CHLO
MVDLAALENDHGLKRRLAAIGLQPMADWVRYGCQTRKIPGSIITACARMFTSNRDLVPSSEKDLKGTPYAETTSLKDNLDHNNCVEYLEELEPVFRQTASFGESCYGKHC